MTITHRGSDKPKKKPSERGRKIAVAAIWIVGIAMMAVAVYGVNGIQEEKANQAAHVTRLRMECSVLTGGIFIKDVDGRYQCVLTAHR